jgi:ABC-type molybdate transport system substrate-binding protein
MARTFNWLTGVLFGAAAILLSDSGAAHPLRIFAAGSLTAAFTEMAQAFPAPPGSVAAPVFGPSGLLRQRIEHGDLADILASADMAEPRALAREQPGRLVVMFTRNRLCALRDAICDRVIALGLCDV